MRFTTLIVSSTLACSSWLFISKDSRIFLSHKFLNLAKMQTFKLSVKNFLCSVVPDDPHFSTKPPTW